MKTIGVRELRQRASEFLDEVKHGRTLDDELTAAVTYDDRMGRSASVLGLAVARPR